MIVGMVNTWSLYHPSQRVEFECDVEEFNPGHWSVDLRCKGVVSPDFVAFIVPALSAYDCIWFLSAVNSYLLFHIQ